MILNFYTYKGSKETLVGPWICGSYILYEIPNDKDYEKFIINKKHLYYKRKSLSKYDRLLRGNINIKYISAAQINNLGELNIYKFKQKVTTLYKLEALEKNEELVINNIKNPNIWYERLLVLTCVFYRRNYLERISYNIDYENIKIEDHMKIISNYKLLPPEYLWDKTINLFKDIYPKPSWYRQEINSLKELLDDS